jgi:thioredoxin-like negative regulator of GroEL
MARRPGAKAPARGARNFAELKAEIDRLLRELARAEQRIQALEMGGADPLVAKRLAELEEGQKIARGLAVEAAVAKGRAEAELKALQRQIDEAPGLYGWLLRRMRKRRQS